MAKRKKTAKKKTRKLKIWVSLGMTEKSDVVDLPDDWDEMSESDQQKYIDYEVDVFASNYVEQGGEVVDDESEGE